MIRALKDGSFTSVVSKFIPTVLKILTYSCTSDEMLFKQVLFQFKDPLDYFFNESDTVSLLKLCGRLGKEMEARNKQWFGKPLAIIGLLKGAHELTQKGKVPGGCFTKDLC